MTSPDLGFRVITEMTGDLGIAKERCAVHAYCEDKKGSIKTAVGWRDGSVKCLPHKHEDLGLHSHIHVTAECTGASL